VAGSSELAEILGITFQDTARCGPARGDFDHWDLELRGGLMGCVRLLMAVEEHGGGKQLLKFRVWPRYSRIGLALTLLFAALSAGAAWNDAWLACAILDAIAFLFLLVAFRNALRAMAAAIRVLKPLHIGKK